ncbi:MAG: DUF3179 domain-containing (seleno)protein [Acidimicrobiales bacterium]
MPAKLRFLIPLAIIGLIGATALAVTSSDDGDPGADSEESSEAASADGSGENSADDSSTDTAESDENQTTADPDAEESATPTTTAPEPEEFDLNAIETGEAQSFGPAPEIPDGPWSEETVTNINEMLSALMAQVDPFTQINQLGDTGDPRVAWVFADLLRFVNVGESHEAMVGAAQRLLPGSELNLLNPWGSTVDQMIAWDVPVPEQQYLDFKRELYGQIEPRWGEMFVDGTDIDWRHVSWGGVGIDDREFGSTDGCRCIPALDTPSVTPADEGDWYPDEALVFGVEINGEARAYPKNIMEVHEMVNDTLGGRDIAMPYCTLCGSAQVYFTDELPEEFTSRFGRPVFRTSGLLIRSNKMMFELKTRSFVDTFRGIPASGPLAEAGIVFDQASVVTTTWADWKAAHPETTIIAEDGGLGRSYELDPLNGRDDNGPIFPIGDVDPRLPVQEPVLGVLGSDGQPIAFHVKAAASLLSGGEAVVVDGIELRLDGGGLRAIRDGADAGGHQAFWFAWSQFYPETKVWPFDF